MKGYTAVLAILTTVLLGLLFLRSDLEATILRLPGQLYEQKGENISNVYTYKIINKTNEDCNNVTFKVLSPKGTIKLVGSPTINVPAQKLAKGTLFIEIHPAFLTKDKTRVKIEVYQNGKLIETTATNFLGPRSFN